MDPAALAGLCALLARGLTAQPLPAGVNCPRVIAPPTAASAPLTTSGGGEGIAALVGTREARDGIARVAYAEAANQGDSGLAAVVYTILNRLQDRRWGGSVDGVLNARAQFEPVLRAGGDWRNLRRVSDAQQARVDTIINLALEGRLPDLTNGARFFQNAQIVAQREAAGAVSPGLTNFGGAPASAVIGAHTFYAEAQRGGGGVRPARGDVTTLGATVPAGIFVGENRAFEGALGGATDPATDHSDGVAGTASAPVSDKGRHDREGPAAVDPARAIFVLSNGRMSDRPQ